MRELRQYNKEGGVYSMTMIAGRPSFFQRFLRAREGIKHGREQRRDSALVESFFQSRPRNCIRRYFRRSDSGLMTILRANYTSNKEISTRR